MDLKIHDGNFFVLPNDVTNNDLQQAYITTALTKKGSIEEDPEIGTTIELGKLNTIEQISGQILHYEVATSLQEAYPELKSKLLEVVTNNDKIQIEVSINNNVITI